MTDTQITATRTKDGKDLETVKIAVCRMRSTAFLHLLGEDGILHTFAFDPADWDRITAEQSADKYAHEDA